MARKGGRKKEGILGRTKELEKKLKRGGGGLEAKKASKMTTIKVHKGIQARLEVSGKEWEIMWDRKTNWKPNLGEASSLWEEKRRGEKIKSFLDLLSSRIGSTLRQRKTAKWGL